MDVPADLVASVPPAGVPVGRRFSFSSLRLLFAFNALLVGAAAAAVIMTRPPVVAPPAGLPDTVGVVPVSAVPALSAVSVAPDAPLPPIYDPGYSYARVDGRHIVYIGGWVCSHGDESPYGRLVRVGPRDSTVMTPDGLRVVTSEKPVQDSPDVL
jgi:hypothetical protein